MLIRRRDFLKAGSLATGSFFLPKFLQAFEGKEKLAAGARVLVIVQLSGGNDGLNTVVPVSNDLYYRSRPGIALMKDKTALLADGTGLHPALGGLRDLYNEGSLAILNDVGYPEPDRSHFRSMDIWQSGSASSEVINSGWLGRWLDQRQDTADKPVLALELDDTLSLALNGDKMKGLAFRDPKRLYQSSRDPYYQSLLQSRGAGQHSHEGETASYLYQVMAETVSGAGLIFNQSQLRPSSRSYPDTAFGKGLQTISSLIASDIPTRVYYISLGSFDTHVGQAARQQKLFQELNDSVMAFVSDLKASGRFRDTLLVSFSEFGRRVSQNASGGTDHGTANNMFLIGGALKKKGLLNAMPDLADLKDGDLQYRVDFKNVYATLLEKWLDADALSVLGKQYNAMDFI